jgi:double-stranded uracil-DNA glycosylase
LPTLKTTRPTREELLAAHGKTVADVIAPDLSVLFCGINPGLYTAAIGHHFGRPGNRFWPALHRAGFTDRQLDPSEERELLRHGWGITNVVARATATADEVTAGELTVGGRALVEKVRTFRPRWVAVLGVGAYRTAFGRPRAALGRQEETMADASVWVLPNPSGLNAHYRMEDLAEKLRELRLAVQEG